MKNKFSKILGVVLTLAVLTSLLTVAAPATPASAGTLAYTTESLASVVTVAFSDYAVSADGNTIYGVVGTNVLYKSTNQGVSWATRTITGASGFNWVAVAPDDANIVVAANATAVWISTNGASTGEADSWNNAGAPGTVAVVRDLTVSPAVSGVRQVTVAGATVGAGAAIATLNLGGTVATWTNIAAGGFIAAATSPVYAIEYSPNYVSDRLLVAVAQNTASVPAGQVVTNLFRFTTSTAGLWNAAAGFTDYTGTTNSTGNIGGPFAALATADLTLAPTYSGTDAASRNAFVAIDDGATGGVYQLKDAVSKLISDAVRMRSVAFNGTNLVAGRADNNVTYRSSDMLATTPTLTSTTQFQRPSGGIGAVAANTQVAWAGTNVVAATTGNEAAFSVSKDNGANYQDISNFNTAASTNISDLAVAADGSKIYYVTTGNGTDTDVNVWARTGSGSSAVHERLFSIIAPASARFSLRLAPENKNILYLVQLGTTNLYYTDDGGDKNWVIRVANDNVLDLAVESSQVIYYAFAGGNVRKSVNGGFLWSDPSTQISSTFGTPASIQSLGKDLVLVTSTGGRVGYSTNGGTSYTVATQLVGGGSMVATSGNLSSGTFLYAAAGTGNTLGAGLIQIYRYKIGSVSPDNVWKSISATAAPTAIFTGLKLVGGNSGILYAHSQDTAGIGSTLWRSMNPAEAGETSVVFSTLLSGATLATSPDFTLPNTRTSNLQISTVSGANTIWGADADAAVSEESGDSATAINDEVYSFADTLSVAPTTVSPAANAVVGVNPVSGATLFVVFSWNRPSLATSYDWQVATDKDFKAVISNNANVAPADPAVSPVAVNLPAGATLNPGTTYYFRMRTNQPLFSPWSATITFSTSSLDKPFAIGGPAVGATGVPVQPVLSWSAYAGALWYEVTVSEDPSFAIPEFSHNVKGNLFYGVTADEALKNNTTYYWRVRGVTAEPYVQGTAVITPSGPWSTGAFTTVAAAAAAPPPAVITVPAPAPPAQVIQLPAPPPVTVPAAIPNWMLMTIIIIGAVLVIALVILIVRTRRVA